MENNRTMYQRGYEEGGQEMMKMQEKAFLAGYEQGVTVQKSYVDLIEEEKEEVDIVLADILASLDKEIKEIPQFEGTLEALNKLTIIK